MTTDKCPIDKCNNEICGGPHYEVLTELGWEVLKVGDSPIGAPKEPTEEDLKHRWSQLRGISLDADGK